MAKKNLQSFNISKETLPTTLIEMSEKVTGTRKYKIEENYETVYDFFGIIYYFRFIEKLESSEIADILGIQVEPLHIHLYNLRWHYSKVYEKNYEEFENEKKVLNEVYKKTKDLACKLDLDSHPKIRESLLKSRKVSESSYVKLNFDSLEDYIKTFYHLIYIDDLTSVQLSILFDLTYTTVHYRLKKLGFNLNHAEGIVKKRKNNRHNYEKTERAKKITTIKNQVTNSSTGSKNENYARFLLANFLYDYFDSKVFDIVVGVNNTGILLSREVDIPLMIHNRDKNILYKFAVEYNGEIFHENDKEKIEITRERGWIYIPILEQVNNRASNNPKIIEKLVRDICEKIKKYVECNV